MRSAAVLDRVEMQYPTTAVPGTAPLETLHKAEQRRLEMSRSDRTAGRRQRRFSLGMDLAVGAAFVAAMVALAHTARADTDLDPFQDLFGDTGINTWTPAADSYLASIDPTGTLAGNLDASVDNFITVAGPPYFYGPDLVFSDLT